MKYISVDDFNCKNQIIQQREKTRNLQRMTQIKNYLNQTRYQKITFDLQANQQSNLVTWVPPQIIQLPQQYYYEPLVAVEEEKILEEPNLITYPLYTKEPIIIQRQKKNISVDLISLNIRPQRQLKQIMPIPPRLNTRQNQFQIKNYFYNPNDVLGRGAFSTVYKGQNVSLQQTNLFIKQILGDVSVAIKEIDMRNFSEEKLWQEIRVMKNLSSPHLVQLYDYEFRGKKCYLIEEYCNFGNLYESYLNLSKTQAYQYMNQIQVGMKVLFNNNIIHRDLKLENIFVNKGRDGVKILKIGDFGLSKNLHQNATNVSIVCGTPNTMAPELLFSRSEKVEYSYKSDVWSLGIIFHELVYKCHPFEDSKERIRLNQRMFIKEREEKAEQFLNEALQQNPRSRMSMEQFLDFPFSPIEKPQSKENPQKIGQVTHNNKKLQNKVQIVQIFIIFFAILIYFIFPN